MGWLPHPSTGDAATTVSQVSSWSVVYLTNPPVSNYWEYVQPLITYETWHGDGSKPMKLPYLKIGFQHVSHPEVRTRVSAPGPSGRANAPRAVQIAPWRDTAGCNCSRRSRGIRRSSPGILRVAVQVGNVSKFSYFFRRNWMNFQYMGVS